ncbi:PREDICTED: uncharacterized protein LOC108531139 isoform X3 [Rhinopithecus bieti]|uniref:uncharacterized protein LOC108531139 isoform X3 n=1 Tax=Rhinopithecus bieti TaxID=61621 RepID=UPI00083C0700|nr:PREDICTED: uncharacterized protein LOC108531139 isoform X3 [Rhinopithecus bieti]
MRIPGNKRMSTQSSERGAAQPLLLAQRSSRAPGWNHRQDPHPADRPPPYGPPPRMYFEGPQVVPVSTDNLWEVRSHRGPDLGGSHLLHAPHCQSCMPACLWWGRPCQCRSCVPTVETASSQ